MSFLRQSTQVVKMIGPYLDKTDGVTEETGLAGAGTEISKEPGAAYGTGPTLGTHDAEGNYPVTLTTTHTDTVGLLKIKGQDAATHLPVWDEWTVVEEAVFDELFKASAAGIAGALVAIDLDHLINTAVADEVVDDSIIAKMVDRSSTADWSSFVHTEDSLRAISEEVSAIGSASGGGFNFAPVGDNALSASINNGGAAVDKSTSPATVGIPVTGHSFLAGHEVTLSLTVAYNNTFVIDSVTTNEVVIVSAFTGETFGSDDLIKSTIKTDAIEGVQTTNTFVSVSGQDGVYHVIDDDGADNFTIAYRYEISGDRIATEAVFTGFLNSGNDNALIQAYDFVGSAWETRRQFDGQQGSVNQTVVVPLLARNTGTDATDIGVVLLRITDGAASTNPTLNVDSFLVEAVGIGQSAGYQNGQIWLDTVGGTDAAVKFVNGVTDKPVKTMGNVVALVAAGLSPDVHVLNGSTVTLTASAANYSFFGDNWTLALGGQSIASAHVSGTEISGTGTGTGASFDHCHFNATTLASGELYLCGLSNTITLSAATDYVFLDCYHEELGAPSTIDFGSAVGASEVHVHGWKGALLVTNMGTGDILHFSSAEGTLTLDSSNDGGTLNLTGTPKLSDSSTGMTTNDNRDQALILADTNELQTDWANGGRLDVILDAIKTVADAIKVTTDKFVFTIANLVDSNMLAISGDTGAADALEALMDGTLTIVVNDASATTTAFATDGFTEATDDIFNGRLITFLTGANQFEQTDITDYDAAGGAQGSQQFTVTALTSAPANNVIAIVH